MDCEERDKIPPKCQELRPKIKNIEYCRPSPEESEPEGGDTRKFKLPSLSLRHMEIVKTFWPSFAMYGLALFVGVIYVTDWKVIVTKLPFYNGKFKEEDAEGK